MCCFVTVFALFGPRAAIVIWWLASPVLWAAAFSSWLWPVIGFFVAPWTTLMWVIVYPGGISLVNWIFLGIAFLVDMGTYFGGGKSGRERYAS